MGAPHVLSPAELLLKLATTLVGIVVGVGPLVEGEARALSASATTRVFSNLHLRDPSFDALSACFNVLCRQGTTPRIPQPPLGHPDHQDETKGRGAT